MKPVREPDVHINGERSRANRFQRFFADRNRMLLERAPEAIVEPHAILPQARLALISKPRERDAALDEGAVTPKLGCCQVREESQPATGDPPCLLTNKLVCLAAGRERHARHPCLHRPPEFDLRVTGPD